MSFQGFSYFKISSSTKWILFIFLCSGSALSIANDNFIDADTLERTLDLDSGVFYEEFATGDNSTATAEINEPGHAQATAQKSIWYKWVADTSSAISVFTTGSNFDTTLGVYTGNSVNTLTPITSTDDGGSLGGNDRSSLVTFTPVFGTTYYFAVDGFAGASGQVYITITRYSDFITGTVNLPNPDVATGIAPYFVSLYATTIPFAFTYSFIPTGTATGYYRAGVPNQSFNFAISASCLFCSSPAYLESFYSNGGSVYYIEDTTSLAANTSHSNINLTLLRPGMVISGILRRPAGYPSNNFVGGAFQVRNINKPAIPFLQETGVGPPESQVNFEINLPVSGPTDQFTLAFNCFTGGDNCIDLEQLVYVKLENTDWLPTTDVNEAFVFLGGPGTTGVDWPLLIKSTILMPIITKDGKISIIQF